MDSHLRSYASTGGYSAMISKKDNLSTGRTLYLARIAAGLSQVELAMLAKTTQATISRFEREVCEDSETLRRVAKLLKVDVDAEAVCPLCSAKI